MVQPTSPTRSRRLFFAGHRFGQMPPERPAGAPPEPPARDDSGDYEVIRHGRGLLFIATCAGRMPQGSGL